MNKDKANKLKTIAKRTVKIIDMLLEGKSVLDIKNELNCDRQLVEYYKKILNA